MQVLSWFVLFGALLSDPAWAAGLYGKSSAVVQINASNFNKQIKLGTKAAMVEFYAPWCGHCQNLKPAYEKAAKALSGLATVAAVNCDEEENKAFCGTMGIKGFPTLKTVRITGMHGRPIIMDYNGGRSASDLVEAVKALIPNIVEKIEDSSIDKFLSEGNDTAKAILFTEKGTTAALTKVLANEYVTHMKFAQVRSKEAKVNKMFGIEKYPTLLVLPGGQKEPVLYDGKMEKDAMNAFLDNYAKRFDVNAAASAKPEASAKAAKDEKKSKKDQKYSSSASSDFAEASASHASNDAATPVGSAPTISLEVPDFTDSPGPEVDAPTPVVIPPVAPPLPTLPSVTDLVNACLGPKTQICVLVLLPTASDAISELSEASRTALQSLADIAQKHKQRRGNLFPFYSLPIENPGSAALKSALELRDGDVQLIAVNGKRGWWMKYAAEKGYGEIAIESWIDGIRFGEGTKHKIPEGVIAEEIDDAKDGHTAEKTIVHEEL